MLRLPLFDKARLAFILVLAILYGFRMFPLQMTVISVVGIVSYILFITFIKKDTMDNGRRMRRTDALETAKVFLNNYQDIWKNLRLSNDNCYLILGADGVSIRGVEKKPEANFYRSFKVIKTNIHSMEEVWNMFCKNFSYNKTYDGLIEECKLYGLVVEEKLLENPMVTGVNQGVNQGNKSREQGSAQIDIKQDDIKKVDINNASQEELTDLPGISVIMAKKAIKRRSEIGGFKTVDEFLSYLNVQPAMADKLKPKLFLSEIKGVKKIEHYNERNVDL